MNNIEKAVRNYIFANENLSDNDIEIALNAIEKYLEQNPHLFEKHGIEIQEWENEIDYCGTLNDYFAMLEDSDELNDNEFVKELLENVH